MCMKVCSHCKVEKELLHFSKNGKYQASWCNECRAKLEQDRRFKAGIKQKIKPIVKDSFHKECLICHVIKSTVDFDRNKRGRLGVGAYCKLCQKSYINDRKKLNLAKFKAKARKVTQKYRNSHREYWRSLHRLNMFKRRMNQVAQSDGTVTEEFMRLLYAKTYCFWCKKYTPKNKRTAEHLIPLSEGGFHSISNLEMACLSCNCSKKNCKKQK